MRGQRRHGELLLAAAEERPGHKRWETREQLRLAIVVWIETKYNRRRRQRGLGKLAPVEIEMIYAAADAA